MAGQLFEFLARGRARGAVLIAFALILSSAAVADAAIIYLTPAQYASGSRDQDNGIAATGGWDAGGFQLEWAISHNGDFSEWTYDYTITITGVEKLNPHGDPTGEYQIKGLSHVIFQLSDDFTADDIISTDPAHAEAPTGYGPGGSNPNMPASFVKGIKFNTGSPTSSTASTFTYDIELVTDRAPIWGSFYAKDGTDGGADVTAWNIGISGAGQENSRPLITTADFTNWIAVPDDVSVDPNLDGVPEPLSLAVWGTLGLAGVVAHSRRRKQA